MNLAFTTLGTSTLLLIFSVLANSNFLMATGELLAGLSGVIIVAEILIEIFDKFHFLKLLASVILISTGLGTFNTYISFDSENEWNYFTTHNLNISTNLISQAQIFANLFCFTLLVLSFWARKKITLDTRDSKSRQTSQSTAYFFVEVANLSNKKEILLSLLSSSLIISLGQAYLLYTGMYGFLSQGVASEEGIINPVVALIASFVPLVNLSFGLLVSKFNQIQKTIFPSFLVPIYMAILAVQCQWNFISASRRELIYSIALFVFGLRLSFIDRNILIDRRHKIKVFVISTCLVLVLSLGIYATSFFRFLVNDNQALTESSSLEMIDYTFQKYQQFNQKGFSSLEKFQNGLDANLSTRTFVLNSLALIMDRAGNKPPLLGDDFIFNFIKSVPGIFYPAKYLVSTSESLYSQKFGIPEKDFADTFYLSAFVDFYWLGSFIYPIIFSCLFFCTTKLALKIKSPLFIIFTTAKLLDLRDLLACAIVISIMKLIFVKRSQFSA
jgi:hypothetical protein